jgi:hypothetical protein
LIVVFVTVSSIPVALRLDKTGPKVSGIKSRQIQAQPASIEAIQNVHLQP